MNQTTIINQVLKESEKRIKDELKLIQKDIDDFTKKFPIPSATNMSKREKYFEERMTGRLSTDNLRKNYERKMKLEKELMAITNFKYVYFKEYEK